MQYIDLHTFKQQLVHASFICIGLAIWDQSIGFCTLGKVINSVYEKEYNCKIGSTSCLIHSKDF